MKQYFIKRLQLLRSLTLVLLGFSLAVPRLGLGIVCLLTSIVLDVLRAYLEAEKHN